MKKIILTIIIILALVFVFSIQSQANQDPEFQKLNSVFTADIQRMFPGETNIKIENAFFTATYSWIQYTLEQSNVVLTAVRISNIDSGATITPTWSNYFDASTYMNPSDSGYYVAARDTSTIGSDSLQSVYIYGGFDSYTNGVTVIDTIGTNKKTLLQKFHYARSVPYVYPFWGISLFAFKTGGNGETFYAYFMRKTGRS